MKNQSSIRGKRVIYKVVPNNQLLDVFTDLRRENVRRPYN